MHGMTTALSLHPMMTEHSQELIETVFKRLRSSDSPHYREAGVEQLRIRCEKLVEAFLRSTRGQAAPFLVYIETLSEERIAEGYFLPEIQLALSILEEQAWRIAVERSSWSSLVPHLSLITTTIGKAKDLLAQIYLQRQQRAETRVGQLERELATLFKGTEGSDQE
jgi:hypothetical protein